MSNKRIVFLSHNDGIGGAERSLLLLAEDLSLRGWECLVILPGDGVLREELSRRGLEARVIPFHPLYWPGSAPRQALRILLAILEAPLFTVRVEEVIREFRPSVIHVNGLPSLQSVLMGMRHKNVVRHVRELYRGWTGRLCRYAALHSSSRLVFISNACMGLFKALPPGCAVIPNGTPAQDELPPMDKKDMSKILIMSQIVPGKGHEVFIEAARKMTTGRQGLKFLIFGNDPSPGRRLEKRLARLAGSYGIEEHLTFCGFTGSPEQELARGAVAVLASPEEPSGRVLLESMAYGTPVVASSGGGCGEIVEDGVTGLLFPPGRADLLAEKILSLLDDPCLYSTIRQRAFLKVRDEFSMARHTEQMEKLYFEVMESPCSSSPKAP